MPARLALALLALVLLPVLASPARAGDARPVTLPLASGQSIEGLVESSDAKEVVVRTGPESVRRVPWAQLLPLGVYRAKAALAPAADGDTRLALAELAIELGLHAEARVEYEKALALGAIDRKAFDLVVGRAERDAVEVGIERSLQQADGGDWERALETARVLKLDFGGTANAGAIDRLIQNLYARVQALQKETAKEAEELERVKVEADRNKEILRRQTEATGLLEAGRAQARKAAEARAIGNVTRAHKYADAADEDFLEARRHLGRLRRILAPEHPTYREVLARLNDLDLEQFRLLYDTAWFFWEGRVYSKAEAYAARASYVDPVHPDLLELRELLRASRIRYRLSDITNARPIIR